MTKTTYYEVEKAGKKVSLKGNGHLKLDTMKKKGKLLSAAYLTITASGVDEKIIDIETGKTKKTNFRDHYGSMLGR